MRIADTNVELRPKYKVVVLTSDVVLKTDLGLKTTFLSLGLGQSGLKDLKNCGLKTKKVLIPFFRPKRSKS